jgi:hypothetical protein
MAQSYRAPTLLPAGRCQLPLPLPTFDASYVATEVVRLTRGSGTFSAPWARRFGRIATFWSPTRCPKRMRLGSSVARATPDLLGSGLGRGGAAAVGSEAEDSAVALNSPRRSGDPYVA